MPHHVLSGGSCFTAADLHQLQTDISKLVGSSSAPKIQGQWLYYVDATAKATAISIDHVKQLLQDVDANDSKAVGGDALALYVTPRYISPWSSKATSIAHVCGLKETIQRIERGRRITIDLGKTCTDDDIAAFRGILHDRMTEIFSFEQPSTTDMFAEGSPAPLTVVDIFAEGQDPLVVLGDYNKKMGLSLDQSEIEYLVGVFQKLGRPPHDVELFMFAQVNSEYVYHTTMEYTYYQLQCMSCC